MSEFRGTPGPWNVLDEVEDWSVDGPVSFTNMFVGVDGRKAPIAILVECGVFRADDRVEANAHLIAAAPDLAAELREARTTIAITRTQIMVELNRGVERWDGVPEALKLRLDAIDGVLAKALGEGQ